MAASKTPITNHVNVHIEAQAWSNEQTLHLAAPYSNPFRWDSRRKLFNDFRQSIIYTPNISFYAGELAYGNRPFEVTGTHPNDVQLRTSSELFHKENIINETIKRFPSDWLYGGYSDGDFTFTRHDWALEAIQLLQHYDFVQLFSSYTDLTAVGYGGSQPYTKVSKSFAQVYSDNNHTLPVNAGWADEKGFPKKIPYGFPWIPVGATGGAWAFRRSAFDTVGGLFDQAILGHGDWFMAFGLVGEHTQGDIAEASFHPHYLSSINEWQNRAALLKKNIGVVDQFAVHHFHGPKSKRGYESRDAILVKYAFDPIADIKRNSQGIWELTGNKPGLRDAIRRYFIQRQEDNPNHQ